MFDLCLFDLDDTLIHTTDLKEIREEGKHDESLAYIAKLKKEVGDITPRIYYPLASIQNIRTSLPKMKIGIFTRAPRSYAKTILEMAYPGFGWDIVLGYEDVKPTKPYGDGILKAMSDLGVNQFNRVVMIGDNDSDIRSAYNAGCYTGLDLSNVKDRHPEHWRAIGLVPDAILRNQNQVLSFLKSPNDHLPELERALEGGEIQGGARFEAIGHFINGKDEKRIRWPIYAAGRFFATNDSTSRRRSWHKLTASISENKNSKIFPETWINTIRAFIKSEYPYLLVFPRQIMIAVVPHRPNREPRLENLLAQVSASLQAEPMGKLKISFQPDLLAYKDGVKSQHGDLLSGDQRQENVRDHLFVNRPDLITPQMSFIVIDDVATTGASLAYAAQYLTEAGAREVKLLALGKNVGDLYYGK